MDNPKVGAALTSSYWKPGNSEQFLDLVAGLTKKPLTGEAWVADLEKPLADVLKEERADYDAALAVPATEQGEVDLDMHVTISDGDKVIAS